MASSGQSPPFSSPVKEKSSGNWLILVLFLIGAGILLYLASKKSKPDLVLTEQRALQAQEDTRADGNELFRGDLDEQTCLQQATALEEAWDRNPELASVGAVSYNPTQRPACRILDRSAEVSLEPGTMTWFDRVD